MTDRPGWYADPSGRRETYRWWDGTSWTRWLSELPDAPPPEEPGPLQGSTAGETYVTDPGHDQPAIRLPFAVGITIGALILAVTLLGVTVSVTADRLPSGAALDPPPKKDQPVVAMYDATTDEYVAGPVRVKPLGPPYDCSDTPTKLRSGSESGFRCDFAVHPDYREGYSWMADTGFGVLPDSMVVPDDLKATAAKVLGQLGSRGYEGVKLRNPKFKAEKLTGITDEPDEAMVVTGTMSYRVPNLPSTGTNLKFVVIKLQETGKHVVFYSDYPNDAPDEVVASSKAAFETLTAR